MNGFAARYEDDGLDVVADRRGRGRRDGGRLCRAARRHLPGSASTPRAPPPRTGAWSCCRSTSGSTGRGGARWSAGRRASDFMAQSLKVDAAGSRRPAVSGGGVLPDRPMAGGPRTSCSSSSPPSAAGRRRLRRDPRPDRARSVGRLGPTRSAVCAQALARWPSGGRTGWCWRSCPGGPRSMSPGGCESGAFAILGNHGLEGGLLPRGGRRSGCRPGRTPRSEACARGGCDGPGGCRVSGDLVAVRRAQGPVRRVPLPPGAGPGCRPPDDPRSDRGGRGAGGWRARPVRRPQGHRARPAGVGGKGAAVEWLLAEVRPRLRVLLGDDSDGREAFAVLRREREGGRIRAVDRGVHAGHEVPREVVEAADVLGSPQEAAAPRRGSGAGSRRPPRLGAPGWPPCASARGWHPRSAAACRAASAGRPPPPGARRRDPQLPVEPPARCPPGARTAAVAGGVAAPRTASSAPAPALTTSRRCPPATISESAASCSAAPAVSDSTSAGSPTTTASLATRFMPSTSGLTSTTSASRRAAIAIA